LQTKFLRLNEPGARSKMEGAGVLSKIAGNLVKSVSSGEMVAVGSFWKTQACVIHFMRRFG